MKSPTFISRKSFGEGGEKTDLRKELKRWKGPHVHQSRGYRIGYPLFSGAQSLKVDQSICYAHDKCD
jgi:hypothetical protein